MNILRRLFGKKPARPDPTQILRAFQDFVRARSWGASRRVVKRHPELLSDEDDALLGQLAEAQEDERTRQVVEEHRALLRRCREAGIKAAFAEKMGMRGQVPLPDIIPLPSAKEKSPKLGGKVNLALLTLTI